MNTAAQINFEKYPIGSKVQTCDKYGYYIMKACGIIVKHLGNGHAIIKSFEGGHRSTVELSGEFSIELL
jgi:hypothetical protein